jgi:signal transduction histidine kinase
MTKPIDVRLLRESEARFRGLFENMTEGAAIHEIILDRNKKAIDYRVLDVNKAFSHHTGIGREKALNAKASELYGASKAPFLDVYANVSATGVAVRFKTYFEPLDRHFEISAFPIGINGFATIFEDVTEKQKIDLALQQAEKLKSIGVLAGGISHDFNNLLAGMFGYIDIAHEYLLKGDTINAQVKLAKAMAVFDRAKNLTQQLLTFAKGGAPVRSIQSIDGIVRKAVEFALSGSNVTPEFAIGERSWFCDVDEHQLTQVIDNIAINARQAMPGGGALEVSFSKIPPGSAPITLSGKPAVRISLRDHGVGIDKKDLPRIFDPFFTTKKQGSGLGLATSYSIVKKHNGHIDVESKPGVGTAFHIYLPEANRA